MAVTQGVVAVILPIFLFLNHVIQNPVFGQSPGGEELFRSVQLNYTPKGHVWKLGDMSIYETNDTNSKTVLFAAYDIFGFGSNVMQVADKISEGGFRVVMPDFFRGGWSAPWPQSQSREAFDKFAIKDAANKESWGWASAKKDLENLIKHYKNQGVTKFGMFGWCWGGKMTVDACTNLNDISAGGLLHAARVTAEDAKGVKCPLTVLPSKGEESYSKSLFDIVNAKFPGRCELNEFYDMAHGFMGGNSNFDDATIKKRVGDGIKILKIYFKKELKDQPSAAISISQSITSILYIGISYFILTLFTHI